MKKTNWLIALFFIVSIPAHIGMLILRFFSQDLQISKNIVNLVLLSALLVIVPLEGLICYNARKENRKTYRDLFGCMFIIHSLLLGGVLLINIFS